MNRHASSWWIRGVFVTGLIFVALLEAAAFLIAHEHHGGFWNAIPMWDLVFGFGGAAVLYLAAKRALGPLLSRPEAPMRRSRGGRA